MQRSNSGLRKETVSSLVKGLDLLCLFTYKDWGIQELSEELNIPKSTVFRLVKTIENKGFIEKTSDMKRYQAGIKLLHIGASANKNSLFLTVSIKIMQKISKQLNECVYLYIIDDDNIVFIYQIECSHSIRYCLDLGKRYDIRVAAAGKAVLAFMDMNLVKEIIDRGLNAYTPYSIIDKDILLHDLHETRGRGFSFSKNERVEGIVGFAAPIIGKNQDILGGINVTIPESRYNQANYDAIGNLIKISAEEISINI